METEKHESPEETWEFYKRILKRLCRQIDELEAENAELKKEAAKAQQSPDPTPAPKPVKAPKVTARMRKAVASFDAMSDSEQVAALQKAVW